MRVIKIFLLFVCCISLDVQSQTFLSDTLGINEDGSVIIAKSLALPGWILGVDVDSTDNLLFIKAVIWTGCLTSWKAIALRREKRCGAGKWAMYMDGMRVVYWMTLLDWLSRMGFIWFTWEMGKGRVMPCRLGQVIIKRPSLLVRSVWWRVS